MKINRRSFLKRTIAAGSVMAGAGSLISACSGLTRSGLSSDDAVGNSTLPLDEIRTTILYLASLAPSGHNSQPWFVKVISQNEWIIGADPSRRLPAVDPQNREALLSIGAFAENLAVAAGAYGLKSELEVIAKDPFEHDILRMSLKAGTTTEYPLQRIRKRMTVKHGYLPGEIKKQDIDALSKPVGGHLVYFPAGTEHADCIRDGAIENFSIQAQRDDAQRELVKWVRLSNEDAGRYRDGLTLEGMEIRGFKGWFVRNFVQPQDFMKASFRRQSVDHTTTLARQGGGWLVITSDGRSVSDLIETGRRFERMALLARERNIAIHPMTQYLEEKTGVNQIAANHPSSMIPQFILRVGYLKRYPEPVSLRRPVSWFVRQ